ncbi:MAG: hypothetical protein R3F31_25835 [Verrucomicrobiales bacterium]
MCCGVRRAIARSLTEQSFRCGSAIQFDLVEDLSPHGYTPKLRQAIFTFFNTHLKGDPTPVTDDVTDVVEPEENLLVFGGHLPENDTMRQMDERLVQVADVALPGSESGWLMHQEKTIGRLRGITFLQSPDGIPSRLREMRNDGGTRDGDAFGTATFDTDDGLTLASEDAEIRHLHRRNTPHRGFSVQPEARAIHRRRCVAPGFCPIRERRRSKSGTPVRRPSVREPLDPASRLPLIGHSLAERQVSDLMAGAALMRRDPATGISPVVLYGFQARPPRWR